MRQQRVEFEGAIYHVMQRGNNKETIFQGEADKRFFIAELANSKKKYGFKLFGYVLLDNHYHLLLQTGTVPLSKIMQRQNSLYSRYHNRVHERIDHLFGLRYKSIIVEDERYLLTVLRYLHWNPVKAGMAKCVSEYKWSSDSFYRQGINGLVDTGFISNILSESRRHAIDEYLRIIQDQFALEKDLQSIIGDEIIVDIIEDGDQNKKELDSILSETGIDDEQLALIKDGSRMRELIPYKVLFVNEALRHGYKIKEIADHVNVSSQAISKLKKSSIDRKEILTPQ